MKSARNIASDVLYLASTARATGRTTALVAAATTLGAVVVCASGAEAADLRKQFESNLRFVGMNDLDQLRGYRKPMVFDHHAVEQLLLMLLNEEDRSVGNLIQRLREVEDENLGMRRLLEGAKVSHQSLSRRLEDAEKELHLARGRIAALLGVGGNDVDQRTDAGSEGQHQDAGRSQVSPPDEPKT